MPARVRALALTLTALLATSGCAAGDAPRPVGDPATAAEARVLADLLHRNLEHGGADFVLVAPYGGAVLRLSGTIDYEEPIGRAEAVTSFAGDRADDVRTLFFTADDLWSGDVPALADALADDGADGATYLRRPLAAPDGAAEPPLLDVALRMLLNLSAGAADDPQAFLDGGCTWEGQRSIDSRLTTVFALHSGTVAVGASDDLLMQYSAPLDQGKVQVTITLSAHGHRSVDLPSDQETAPAADHPEIAAALGI
jgi:hypothetical protein